MKFALDGNRLTIYNLLAFRTLDDLNAVWAVTRDGVQLERGRLDSSGVAPYGEKTVEVPFEMPEDGDCFLEISVTEAFETMWAPAGHEVTFEQIPLKTASNVLCMPMDCMPDLLLDAPDGAAVIYGEDFEIIFDERTGEMVSWEKSGVELLSTAPHFNAWRAPIDNDVHQKEKWAKLGLDKLQARLESFRAEQLNEKAVRVTVTQVHAAYVRRPVIRTEITYTIYGSGDVRVNVQFMPLRQLTWLPKLGVQLAMPLKFDRVMWFGRGAHENYPDMKMSAPVAQYSALVSELHEPYVRPQENGARQDTRVLAVTDILGNGLMFVSEKAYDDGFSFTCHDYSDQALDEAKHTNELEQGEETVVSIDYRQCGVGSNICGPEPMEQYKEYLTQGAEYTFVMKPYNRQLGEMMTFGRIVPEEI